MLKSQRCSQMPIPDFQKVKIINEDKVGII